MHPALTHELTRAVLADRERETRHAALALAIAGTRPRPADRPFVAPRRPRSRRLAALVARLRSPGGAPASAR